MRISVRVKPRAARSKILGLRGDELEVAVAAPPVDGAANDALCEVLAEALRVPRGSVDVVAGAKGRSKIIEVAGLSVEEATQRLALGGVG